jgi:hypothetical protein
MTRNKQSLSLAEFAEAQRNGIFASVKTKFVVFVKFVVNKIDIFSQSTVIRYSLCEESRQVCRDDEAISDLKSPQSLVPELVEGFPREDEHNIFLPYSRITWARPS